MIDLIIMFILNIRSSDDGPEAHLIRKELKKRIFRMIKQFTLLQRKIFVLRYIKGHSNQEVASMIHKNPNDISVINHVVIKRLREDIIIQFLKEHRPEIEENVERKVRKAAEVVLNKALDEINLEIKKIVKAEIESRITQTPIDL
jgi:hypothetical protein